MFYNHYSTSCNELTSVTVFFLDKLKKQIQTKNICHKTEQMFLVYYSSNNPLNSLNNSKLSN